MVSFKLTPFAAPLLKSLQSAGFVAPTPTQAQVTFYLKIMFHEVQAWPIVLAGRDVITVAKTGTTPQSLNLF